MDHATGSLTAPPVGRRGLFSRVAMALAGVALTGAVGLGGLLAATPDWLASPWAAAGLGLGWSALLTAACLTIFHRLTLRPLARLAVGDGWSGDEASSRDCEIGRLARRIEQLTRQQQSHKRDCQRCAADFDQAKRQVTAAQQARAQFIATISHELRTPLNAIIGFSQLMRDDMLGNGTQQQLHAEFAGEIHASGTHLLETINEMLELANIEGGRRRLALTTIDVTQMIDVSLRAVAGRAASGELRLTADLADDARLATGDFTLVKQMLHHLLDNAVKFTPPGGAVTVRTRRRDDVIVFEIHDTGIGMSASDAARAFQPFWQAAPALSRAYDGAGLGLTLVKAMADLHAGDVGIISAPGQGTTVSLALPLHDEVNGGSVNAAAPSP